MSIFSKVFRPREERPASNPACIPRGQRVYAIGDIHGRLDLLEALIGQIEADERERGAAETSLIFLGDLIDRGPESAGVVARLLSLAQSRPRVRFLLGNHEEVFLDALSGNMAALKFLHRIGGDATMMSYGIDAATYEATSFDDLMTFLRTSVPAAHVAFLEAFEDQIVIGDYAFVHAGIRPGVALASQKVSDLRWIRNEFLEHAKPFEKTIVHGHTIKVEIDERTNRIGLDTGAYATGRLTAMGFEDDQRWVLQAGGTQQVGGTAPLRSAV